MQRMRNGTRWAIMQEPGAQAHANRAHWIKMGYTPSMTIRPKRAGTVIIYDEGQKFALEEFVYNRYLTVRNRQYAGHRFEWKRSGKLWRHDDGNDPDGREWSVVVKLRNGVSVHETRFYAWKEGR